MNLKCTVIYCYNFIRHFVDKVEYMYAEVHRHKILSLWKFWNVRKGIQFFACSRSNCWGAQRGKLKFKEAIKNGSFLIGYFSECKDHNCGIQDCEAARRRSVRYIEGRLYGLFNPRQKKRIIKRFLWSGTSFCFAHFIVRSWPQVEVFTAVRLCGGVV